MLWKGNLVSQNIRKCLISAFALEGGCTEEHLIDQYAQRPPVHCACMATTFDYFWRNVLFRTHKGVCTKVGYA